VRASSYIGAPWSHLCRSTGTLKMVLLGGARGREHLGAQGTPLAEQIDGYLGALASHRVPPDARHTAGGACPQGAA